MITRGIGTDNLIIKGYGSLAQQVYYEIIRFTMAINRYFNGVLTL